MIGRIMHVQNTTFERGLAREIRASLVPGILVWVIARWVALPSFIAKLPMITTKSIRE